MNDGATIEMNSIPMIQSYWPPSEKIYTYWIEELRVFPRDPLQDTLKLQQVSIFNLQWGTPFLIHSKTTDISSHCYYQQSTNDISAMP